MDSPRIRVVSSRGSVANRNRFAHLSLIAAVVIGAVACGDDDLETTVAFRLHGSPPLGLDGRCPESSDPSNLLIEPTSVRLTYRFANGGDLVCDAVLDFGVPGQVVAVPVTSNAGIDVYAELYDDDGTGPVLIGTGLARSADLSRPGEVRIFVTPRHEFVCTPQRGTSARAFHSVTLLPDGSVLIAGGVGAVVSNQYFLTNGLEIYRDGNFTPLSAQGMLPRAFHSATVLADQGDGKIRVAIFGGVTVPGDAATIPALDAPLDGLPGLPFLMRPAATAVGAPTEVLTYDPETSLATVVGVGLGETTPRLMASATPTGASVPVIAGGWIDATRLTPEPNSQGIDTATGTAAFTVDLLALRYGATTTQVAETRLLTWGGHIETPALMRDSFVGEVLQLGGVPTAISIALADPLTPPLSRAFHAAAATGRDNELIVAGGFVIDDVGATVPAGVVVERIRFAAATAVAVLTPDGAPAVPAGYPDALTLADGDVLITGGNPSLPICDPLAPLACAAANAYRYRTQDERLENIDALLVPRYGHKMVQTPDGDVLVTGGMYMGADGLAVLEDGELFNAVAADYDPIADLATGRAIGEAIQPCTVLTAPAQ